MENGKSEPNIKTVRDIGAGILGAPPAPMRTSEIVWSRTSAMRNSDYPDLSEAQQNALLQGIMKWGTAHRYHAMLATKDGEPAGSGVCVTSGGRRGILTARHVLYADGEREERLSNLVICFAPSREMIQERYRRDGRQNSREPLRWIRGTGISIKNSVIVTPHQQTGKNYPDPGLPDISIIIVSDDIEGRLRSAARAEENAVPEPQWVDLDREDLVSIPYGPTNQDDKMLMGGWLITGLRGERSDVKKMYNEIDVTVIDRIYRRAEYEYYGVFVDKVGGSRAQSRGWKGTSGGGVWQQRFTQSGRRKIEQFSPPPLTAEDLEPPVLGGIAFFHEIRKSPQELRGDLDGAAHYREELYAHRIGGTLLDLIRREIRNGVKTAEMGEAEPGSEAAQEQGAS